MRKLLHPYSQSYAITRNAGFLVGGQILSNLITFPVGVIIARRVGVQAYGEYSVALALVGVASGFFLMGLDMTTVRETARFPQLSKNSWGSVVVLSAIWSALLVIVLQVISIMLGYSEQVRLLLWFVGFSSASAALSNLTRALFRGLEKMELDAISRIAESALALVCTIFIAFFSKATIITFAVSLCMAQIATLAIVLYLGIRLVCGQSKEFFSAHRGIQMILTSLPIGFFGLITGIYYRLDGVLLTIWRQEREVGLYNIAYGLSIVWLPISINLARAVVPKLSQFFLKRDKTDFRLLMRTGLNFSLLGGVSIALILYFLPHQIISLLYGDEYVSAAQALRILGGVAAVNFVSTYLLNVLVACDKQKVLPQVALIGLVVMFCFSIVLIPRLGIVGAAISALLRELAMLVLYVYYVSNLMLGWKT